MPMYTTSTIISLIRLVSITHFNSMPVSTNGTNYSYHIKVVELDWLIIQSFILCYIVPLFIYIIDWGHAHTCTHIPVSHTESILRNQAPSLWMALTLLKDTVVRKILWICTIVPLLFTKLAFTVYLNHSICLNVTHHRFYIRFNTFKYTGKWQPQHPVMT